MPTDNCNPGVSGCVLCCCIDGDLDILGVCLPKRGERIDLGDLGDAGDLGILIASSPFVDRSSF